jgi:hypothetical protein
MIAMALTATPIAIPASAPVEIPLDCVESSEAFVDVPVAVAVAGVSLALALVDCATKSADRQRIEIPFALMPSAVVVQLVVVPPCV